MKLHHEEFLTAWMDLFHHDIPEVTTIEFFNLLTPALRQEVNDLQDPDDQRQRLTELREAQINNLRNGHRGQFPLTDNLMSLVFLGTSRPERESAGTFCYNQCRFVRLTWLSILICKSSSCLWNFSVQHALGLQIQPSAMSSGLLFWSSRKASMMARPDTG